jgi:hypothetical protein
MNIIRICIILQMLILTKITMMLERESLLSRMENFTAAAVLLVLGIILLVVGLQNYLKSSSNSVHIGLDMFVLGCMCTFILFSSFFFSFLFILFLFCLLHKLLIVFI